MKGFPIALVGIIFVVLIACSVQSISADHTEPGKGIFVDADNVDIITTQNSNYKIYLQTVLRNADGQLINVTESTEKGAYIPHKISDDAFDTLMGKKEIVTIDNIKYEKVQYTFTPTLVERWTAIYPLFSEVVIEFEIREDARAEMHNAVKNYSIWKLQHCADWEGGHGFSCIPLFQVLVPTLTLEPDDVITLNWTILRELN